MNVLFFAVAFGFVSATLAVTEHEMAKNMFAAEINGLASCPGFKEIPENVNKTLEHCAKESNVFAAACHKTCVFRQLNLIQEDDGHHKSTKGIDYGMMDQGAMAVWKMDTHEGRKSYYRISQVVRNCGHAFSEHHHHWIAKDYKDAKECEKGTQFFDCIIHAFKCKPAM